MPARAGLRGTVTVIVCCPEGCGASAGRAAAPDSPCRRSKTPISTQVVHRHLGLDARAVDHHLARPHVERHLPGACCRLLRRGSLRLELPERVHLEQVVQQVLQRVRRHRLQLAIEIERRRQGSLARSMLLIRRRSAPFTRSSPMYSLSAYSAKGPLR